MTTDNDAAFLETLPPKIRDAVKALDAILRTDPAEFTTGDLVQVWASLDYAHAAMRLEVYRRPDVGRALLAAIEALGERGLIRH